MRALPIPRAVRELVLERAGWRCERCGRSVAGVSYYSLQHRRARGMGGSRRVDVHSPSNLGVLCGHATQPDRCHQWIEAHPIEATAEGWRVAQGRDPATIPVWVFELGAVLLTAEFTYVRVRGVSRGA